MFNYIEKDSQGNFVPKRANYRSPRFVADIPDDIERKYYAYIKVDEVIKTNEVTGGKYKDYEVYVPDSIKEKVEKKEKEEAIQRAKANLRQRRINILNESDKIVTVPDFPVTEEEKKLWVEYRNYVRLINDTLEDEEFLDFKLLSFDEWKDKR
jgi:hypothetical protein